MQNCATKNFTQIPSTEDKPNDIPSSEHVVEKSSKVFKISEFTQAVGEMLKIKKKRVKLMAKMKKEAIGSKFMPKLKSMEADLTKKIHKKETEIKKIKLQLYGRKQSDQYATGIAFISFKQKSDRDAFISKWHHSFITSTILRRPQLMYKGCKVKVNEAPEPSDVIWANLGLTIFEQLKRRVLTTTGSLFVLSIGFVIITAMKFFQKSYTDYAEQKDAIDRYITTALSLLTSLMITLVNFILKVTIKYFVSQEKRISFTEFDTSFSQKLVVAQILNTCGLVYITHVIFNRNGELFYIWQPGGLIYDAAFVLLSNTLLSTFKYLFDPDYVIKIIQRYKYLRNPNNTEMLQFEANSVMEGRDLDLALSFSNLLVLYYMVIFFLPILPVGGFLLLISTISIYYTQRYLFSRVYKKPKEVSRTIGLESINGIGYGPLVLYVL